MADRYLEKYPLKRKLFWIWASMRQRCRDKKQQNYYLYGGRGIKVCDRWEKFDHFYEDMNLSYKPGLTIDRINTNGDYSPKNCRWATKKEQALNTRNIERANKFTFKGLTKTIREWAEYTGIKRSTLYMRLIKYGWSIEKSLTEEVVAYG